MLRRSRLRLLGRARRGTSPGRRFLAAADRVREGVLRDNKVLPMVLAVLALLIFAWLFFGIFWDGGGRDNELGTGANEQPIRNQSDLAQAPDDEGGGESTDPETPGTENRDAESFAVFETKDPFREIVAEASTDDGSGDDTSGDGGDPGNSNGGNDQYDDTTQDTDGDGTPDSTDSAPNDPATGGTGGSRNRADLDEDGIPDADENDGDLDDDGTADADDPDSRDSDNDGTTDDVDPDGQNGTGDAAAQDSDGDGTPDSQDDDVLDDDGDGVVNSQDPTPNGETDEGNGGGDTGDDDLFDSGGDLPDPLP